MNNWFNFIDVAQKENIYSFYTSLNQGDLSNENIFISYPVFDQDLNKVMVKEVIKSVAVIEEEKRIKSLIQFEVIEDDTSELKLQANSFKAVIASLMHGLIVTDEKGKVLMANPVSEQITGFGQHELRSMTIHSLMGKSDEILSKSPAAKKPQLVSLKTKSGEPITCNLLYSKFLIRNRKYHSIEFYVRGYKTPGGRILTDQLKIHKNDFNLFNDNTFLIYLIRFYRFLFINTSVTEGAGLNDLEDRLLNHLDSPETGMNFENLRRILAEKIPSLSYDSIQYSSAAILGLMEPGEIEEYFIDYGINFISDGLNKVHNGGIIFHREAAYNRTLKCDPALLIFSVYHLIQNSLESVKMQGDLYIKTSFHENKFRLSITDTGEGIPPEVRKKLFISAYSTKKDHLGFGLFFIRKIIDSIGGEVLLKSQHNKGTEIIIEIPTVNR